MGLFDWFKNAKGPKPRILVVDDEEHITRTVVANLDGDGYEAQALNDSSKVLAVADAWKPQLILLDLMMPAPDGFDVYRQLKQNVASCNIPVVFMTVKSEEEITKTSTVFTDRTAFYRYHLQKPFSKSELLSKVSRLLQGEW